MKRFFLIGDGIIAQRHKKAIEYVEGELVGIYDPALIEEKYYTGLTGLPIQMNKLYPSNLKSLTKNDYVVICSPNNTHRNYCKMILQETDAQIICEKPLCLPWEPIIDDDRINVVLQLRWINDLPEKADLVKAVMVRDKKFFESWKGDPFQAGGNIYEFFIHYIDLAIRLDADFEGEVLMNGQQVREIQWQGMTKAETVTIDDFEIYRMRGDRAAIAESLGATTWKQRPIGMGMTTDFFIPSRPGKQTLDLMKIDMQDLYNRMYEDILKGKGVKPKDIFYLTWVLNRTSHQYGYRMSGVYNRVRIEKELL